MTLSHGQMYYTLSIKKNSSPEKKQNLKSELGA